MLRIVYFSSATKLFSKEELIELLVQLRDKKSNLGITGMLLYEDGCFMGIIEGEEQTVLQLHKTICHDTRHKSVITVVKNHIDERYFSDWSMGFRCLNDKNVCRMAGYHPFMNTTVMFRDLEQDDNICLDLLNTFKKNLG